MLTILIESCPHYIQAAEERRRQFEREQQESLAAREKRAAEVRAKKVSLAPDCEKAE